MISERLKSIIIKELGLEDFVIEQDAKANQIPGWDSLNHISIIVAIEESYGIRLPGREVRKLENIAQLQELINEKLSAKNDI